MQYLWRAAGAALVSWVVTGLGLGASPLAAAADAEAAPAKVLVLPFAPLNPAEAEPWLGKSIQQSLVADLTVAAPGRVISASDSAADATSAVDAARRAGAAYVLLGNFATAGNDLRVTGQVLDANTRTAVTAVKATGRASDVFTLEDELTAQVRRRLVLNPARPTTRPVQAADESVPPMEPLRVAQAKQPVDPYVQAYGAPVDSANSPDRQQLDYDYYLSQPPASPYLAGCGGYGVGGGWGFGFSYYGYGGYGGAYGAWGGGFSHAAHGTNGVNPTAGTPLAPGLVFHPTSHASRGRAR